MNQQQNACVQYSSTCPPFLALIPRNQANTIESYRTHEPQVSFRDSCLLLSVLPKKRSDSPARGPISGLARLGSLGRDFVGTTRPGVSPCGGQGRTTIWRKNDGFFSESICLFFWAQGVLRLLSCEIGGNQEGLICLRPKFSKIARWKNVCGSSPVHFLKYQRAYLSCLD